MTSARDLGAVTIRRVEMTMAPVDLFRSERPSDGFPRPYGMEDATTGPHHASREQRDLHPLKSLDSRGCCGETRGDGPAGSLRYIGGTPKGRGERSVNPINGHSHDAALPLRSVVPRAGCPNLQHPWYVFRTSLCIASRPSHPVIGALPSTPPARGAARELYDGK
jgi:hypothetical protein